ncbi:lanthionine synthetase LanC family protein, partial [Saccharicrinis fermentans]
MQIEFREDNNIEKILHAIDVTLEKHVLNSSKRNKYDFFSGLSTIGLYFYLRESKPQQGLFMNQLFADFKSKNFIIDNNPGVAHGWGSAFLLSLKIAQKNHKVKSAYYDFFNDMQKMVLRKVQDENNIFQSRTGHKIRTTSWSKGMLPICLALEKSYELCSDSLSCFEPRKLAKNIINYSISIENYDDPCLCHGTASIAMLCGQFLPIPYYTDAATKACDKWNGALISQLETTVS